MNAEFVMTKDDIIEMKQKAKKAKCSGVQSKNLAPTSYEQRCNQAMQMQVDLNGWEPDDEFMEWLLKAWLSLYVFWCKM